MIDQTKIFKIIEKQFSDRGEFLQAIADTLCVTLPNVRRRISGQTKLIYEEVQKLVETFSLGMEDLFPGRKEILLFTYRKLDLPDIENYVAYLEGLLAMWERAAEDKSSKISIVTDEIPIFYFMDYPQLTMFKLYSYAYDMDVYKSSFESFVEKMEKHDFTGYFKRISTAYSKIESIEIWDNKVLNRIIHDLNLKQDLDCFKKTSTVDDLKNDLRDLLNNFRKTVVKGSKNGGGKLGFLHKESINRLSFMLVEDSHSASLSIKLHTINSMTTRNIYLIEEGKKWVKSAIDSSLALSLGSKSKRKIYFDRLIDRIDD